MHCYASMVLAVIVCLPICLSVTRCYCVTTAKRKSWKQHHTIAHGL